MQQNVLTSFA